MHSCFTVAGVLRRVSVLGMLALAACESPLSPSDVAGTYVFAPPGGLRFQIDVAGTPQEFTLAVHDTLTLRADGSGVLSGVSSWITPPPDPPTVGPRTIELTYRIDDRTLRAEVLTAGVCLSPYVLCLQTYRVAGDAIIRENGAPPEYREVFTRVGPPLR